MSDLTASVVSALIRNGDHLLLVEERERTDTVSTWMLPGGKVEPGETLTGALRREVREETGLTVIGEPAVAFMVEIVSVEGRYVAITFSCESEGKVEPQDPDRLVLDAAWLSTSEAMQRLSTVAWYDCMPLERYLSGDAPPGATYRLNRR